jgi:transcription-repair coupling factor (superfamily II helicase)
MPHSLRIAFTLSALPHSLTDTIDLSGLLSLLSEQAPFQQLARELDAPHEGEWRLPVLRAARPLLLASLAQNAISERPILVIAAKLDRAQALYESLRAYGLTTPDRLLRFPEPSALFYERAPWPREVVAERLQVLARLTTEHRPQATDHEPARSDVPSSCSRDR